MIKILILLAFVSAIIGLIMLNYFINQENKYFYTERNKSIFYAKLKDKCFLCSIIIPSIIFIIAYLIGGC